MFLLMSRIPASVAAALAVTAPAVALARSSSHSPTPAQIKQRVSRAERSRDLWATVNICSTHRHPRTMGVRGQIPALGFKTGLTMTIEVQYWAKSKHRYEPDSATHKLLRLGNYTTGLHQAGYSFKFASPAMLRAQIAFQWKLGSKVIGNTSKVTAGGIKHVDFSDPAGYSSATCKIR